MPSQTRRVQNVVRTGGAWNDPNNIIKGNEGLCATTLNNDAQLDGNFLDAGTPFTIPAGATITGIGVVTKFGGDGGDECLNYVVDDNAVMQGPISAGTPLAANCGATAEQPEVGGATERWNGVWSVGHINSEAFEAHVHYEKDAKANTMYFDYIDVTVYYEFLSKDLAAAFEVRRDGTQELPAEFVVQVGLLSGSQELLGEFVVRRDGSQELGASFDGQVSLNLPAEFVSRQADSQELLGELVIRRDASQELLGEFDVRRDGSQELPAEFIVRQPESQELLGEFIARQSGSQELLGEFVSRQAGSQDLGAIFDGQMSLNLSAEFVARRDGSQELLGEFEIRRDGSRELAAEFIVRRDGSQDLLGEFIVRQPGSQELLGEFVVRRDGSQELLGEFISRQPGSQELLGEFVVRRDASQDLLGEFDVRRDGSRDLAAEFIIRHDGSQELLAGFDVPALASGSQELLGEFVSRQSGSQDLLAGFNIGGIESVELLGEFVVRHLGSQELLGEFTVRHADSEDLLGTFEVGQGSADLPASFDGQVSLNLPAEFISRHSASEELAANLDVSYRRVFGENWQRKMWFDGQYYWRSYYDLNLDSFVFEYIDKDGLSGNVWTENVAARINAAGFDAAALEADFSVRGAENGIPISIIYSDGRDVFVAESDEASALGWAWENNTKVFDATAPDWYRYVALFGDRKTPTHRLYVAAVYYDDAPGAVQYVRQREQTTPGDITGWEAIEDVSNVANTDKIRGVAGRSMGSSGATKKEIIVVYKEGAALRSRYHTAAGHFEAIQTIDATTHSLKFKACFDIEHWESGASKMVHVIYIDADGSVRTAERDAGVAEVWGDYVTVDSGTAYHTNVCIASVETIQTYMWQDSHHIGYRLHRCNPETWWPPIANPYNEFDPATEGIVTTTGPPTQMQSPDSMLAGEAVAISWAGTIASAAGIGWGILTPATNEALFAEFTVRQSGSAELSGKFTVRHTTTLDLPASFDGQVSRDLPAEFIVKHPDSAELLGEFIIRHKDEAGLLGEFISRHADDEDLLGEFIVRYLSSAELLGVFTSQQAASVELSGEFIIRHIGSADLLSEFVIRHVGIPVELLGEFVARHADSEDLLGTFEVGQGSADLPASFDGQVSLNLPAEFISRQSASADLKMGFWVWYYGADLLCQFYVRPKGSMATDFEVKDLTRGLTIHDPDRVMTVTPRRKMKVK